MAFDTLLLFALPIAIGAVLLTLARWAARTNQRLDTPRAPFRYDDFPAELLHGDARVALRKALLGSLDDNLSQAGRGMAISAIGAVVLVLAGVALALAFA